MERLEDALRRLAVEAADLFGELLAQGAEIPFEVEPTDDGPLPMFQYSPLTGQFIEGQIAELRTLEAFVEVRELAGEETAIGFMKGLWEGRTQFEVAGDRLRGAIDGVLATMSGSGDGTPAGEVIVPLIGFHMPADEIVLDGVRIVRADLIADAPVEAVDATRAGRKGRPGFLAQVSCGFATKAPAAAVADDLRRAIRTIRLFRPGAVGLGAHGWARHAGGWERFSTGMGRARHGGYRLTGNEAADLENFSRLLTERGARLPALDWAASRFELGAERASLIEALSDYLLALRGLLEGGEGPARAGLATRVAAVACEPAEREAARICVERALSIERKLMSGARFKPAVDASPLTVIAELEELLRRVLKKVAKGELEGDLRAAADEILLTDGLEGAAAAAGEIDDDADLGETGDDTDLLPAPILGDPTGEPEDEIRVTRGRSDETTELTAQDGIGIEEEIPEGERIEVTDMRAGEAEDAPDSEADDPVGEHPTTRIDLADVELPRTMSAERQRSTTDAGRPVRPEAAREVFRPEPGPDADWFAAGEVEWPAFASPRRESDEERAQRSDRVRYLFPVPDATDWDVGELYHERKRAGS